MRILIFALAVCLSGCEGEEGASPETCDRSITGTGDQEKILNPGKQNSCKGVVLVCNYCEYDADGRFDETSIEPCGVCVGWDD